MHENEIEITPRIVKDLLAQDFPQWMNLPIHQIVHSGTDNAVFRLGDEMIIRLPRVSDDGSGALAKNMEEEFRILKLLSVCDLPLSTPKPLGMGNPSDNYPNAWFIQTFVNGNPINPTAVVGSSNTDLQRSALAMGTFVKALRGVAADGIRLVYRGMPLENRSQAVQKALSELTDLYDTHDLERIWARCLRAKKWRCSPSLIHADLLPGNPGVRMALNNKYFDSLGLVRLGKC